MTNITPFNELLGTPSANGTWSQISGSTALTMPATYNDTITFDSLTDTFGTYVFEYSLLSPYTGNTLTQLLTVEFQDGYVVFNNDCTQSAPLSFPYPTTSLVTGTVDNRANCPGSYATTSTVTPWAATYTPYGNDIWFSMPYDPANTANTVVSINVAINGAQFSSNGITNPWVGVIEDNCANAATQVEYGVGQDFSINYVTDWTTAKTIYFIVGCKPGDEGQFTITATST